MKIGIVGAGFIGRAIARLSIAAGHEAMVSNSRGPRSLASVPSGIGAQIGTVTEAATFGDTVVIAIPFGELHTLEPAMFAGEIVIDANNYYPDRDGAIPVLDDRTTTTSEMLAARLPDARVVKAFNAILARDLEVDGRPIGYPDRRALPVAANDEQAKALVMRFIDDLGFDPVDAGALAESWRFERDKPVYCVPLTKATMIEGLAAAKRDEEMMAGSWRP